MTSPSNSSAEVPSSAASFAAKARDLESLRLAVIDAASVSENLWFSYIFVLLYLLIAVGSVTHQDLFFEHPVKLPFLNIDLPLMGFFILGPLLFIVIHIYVLLHFVLLSMKIGAFHVELREQLSFDDDVRARLRRQLPSNIFVQFLAGPREIRAGIVGHLLTLIAYISLVIGSISLLVFFLIQFLAYHDWRVTWWHRFAVVIDIVIAWRLWLAVATGKSASFRGLSATRLITAGSASLAVIGFIFFVANYPGEWLNKLPHIRILPTTNSTTSKQFISIYDLLIAGDVDFISRKATSLWSNRLVLTNIQATGKEITKDGEGSKL